MSFTIHAFLDSLATLPANNTSEFARWLTIKLPHIPFIMVAKRSSKHQA